MTDNSLVEAIQESLESPSGVLFPYRNIATGTTDTEGIRRVLIAYWSAVRDTFPDAWGKPPTRVRLMHGVGIRAMGRLMDRVMTHVPTTTPRRWNWRARAALVAPKLPMDQRNVGRLRPRMERPAEHASSHQCAVQLLVRTYLAERTGATVKFYFPDSQDLVSPTYDFLRDEYSALPSASTGRSLRPRGPRGAAVPRDPRQQVDRRRLDQGRRQVLGGTARSSLSLGRPPVLSSARQTSKPLATTAPSTTSTKWFLPSRATRDARLLRGVRLRRRRQRGPHHLRLRPDGHR